ncbi:hypothetical protein PLICRDRAFT_381762 [Plicaturopsis crispa FD-325 SS-3]|nr:hypothetical protein PLICRDRAFT_381762 [Plicaturopsis crispa FD-325 SS-3]
MDASAGFQRWSESNNWSLLETLWRQRFNARRVTDEHAALTRVRDLQDDYANRKRDLALDSASAAQSSTPFKKRKITLDSDESSSEDGDGASSTQNDEDASVDAPEPDAAPEETHHDILDDNNEEESAPPSTDITSEQKPEVCMDKKPTNMGAAADTVISSEDILVEHISNVLGSLKAAREAQKAAVRERDEAKSAREAEARRLSDAVRERDEITRERDKAIRKLETQLKASEDEKTLSASLKIADKARLAAEKKYAALKDTLAGVLAASE